MASHARSYRAGVGKGAAAPVASPARAAPIRLLFRRPVRGGGGVCVGGVCYLIANKVTGAPARSPTNGRASGKTKAVHSVYHDRTVLFQLRPWSQFRDPLHFTVGPQKRPLRFLALVNTDSQRGPLGLPADWSPRVAAVGHLPCEANSTAQEIFFDPTRRRAGAQASLPRGRVTPGGRWANERGDVQTFVMGG